MYQVLHEWLVSYWALFRLGKRIKSIPVLDFSQDLELDPPPSFIGDFEFAAESLGALGKADEE